MKAVILAGGRGTRISEETHLRPKPMVEIGGRPILWHIMKIYAAHGVTDFLVCLGYQGYVIKEYFANYLLHTDDVTFDLAKGRMEFMGANGREPWRVTLIDTGLSTETGGRVRRLKHHLENEDAFCLTYGDGLGNVDIAKLLAFHGAHKKLATMTVVHPPGRFGVVGLDGDQAVTFHEKPNTENGFINGGFFVLSPRVLDLIAGDRTIWEREPLEHLAEKASWSRSAMTDSGSPWIPCARRNKLEAAWATGSAPWKIWE